MTLHATPVGTGTVARIERIPMNERAEAAVIAWLRHRTTAYNETIIYCDQPAKVLVVETQDGPRRTVHPSYQATLSIISPQTSAKVVGGYGTAVDHVLAMAFDDPSMDDDLHRVLNTHEVVLDGEWPDIW